MMRLRLPLCALFVVVLAMFACGSTEEPETRASIPTGAATAAPTDSPIPPTVTPVPPTATPVPPTSTAVPPTEPAAPPTETPVPAVTPTPEDEAERTEAQVVRVIDGDTIEVAIEGQPYRLRYIGMDCPEGGTPQGERAKAENEALVGGQTVYLERDVSETDPHDRLLRYVYLADGTLVNNRMVRLGFAIAKEYPPDTRFSARFAKSQAFAEENLRGFWAPVAAAGVPAAAPVCGCGGNLYNCKDFSTHSEAQACYDYCVASGFGDVHQLDSDDDGSACESLP